MPLTAWEPMGASRASDLTLPPFPSHPNTTSFSFLLIDVYVSSPESSGMDDELSFHRADAVTQDWVKCSYPSLIPTLFS